MQSNVFVAAGDMMSCSHLVAPEQTNGAPTEQRGAIWRNAKAVLPILVCLALGMLSPCRAPTAEEYPLNLYINAGKLEGAGRTIRARQGERIILSWSSDRSVTVHLHGYDIQTYVSPGAPAEMTVDARATGRFPIELHDGPSGHGVLLYLEVYPR
jgi:hypothetical protein